MEVDYLMVQLVLWKCVDAESRLPDALKNLIISRQMIHNANEESPVKKKIL